MSFWPEPVEMQYGKIKVHTRDTVWSFNTARDPYSMQDYKAYNKVTCERITACVNRHIMSGKYKKHELTVFPLSTGYFCVIKPSKKDKDILQILQCNRKDSTRTR
eukprot:UN33257